MKALNKTFSPEFLNRIDDIVVFDNLERESIFKIIDIELKGFYNRVEELGYKLSITDEAKDFIAEKGYDIQYGARPLKRAIQKYLEDGIAELILDNTINQGNEIYVNVNENKDDIIVVVK